jgi:hypothetical protein
VCPSLEVLVPALREGGVEALDTRISLTPGTSLFPGSSCIVCGQHTRAVIAGSEVLRDCSLQAAGTCDSKMHAGAVHRV